MYKTKLHKHLVLCAIFRSNKVIKRKGTFKKWFWSGNPKYALGELEILCDIFYYRSEQSFWFYNEFDRRF